MQGPQRAGRPKADQLARRHTALLDSAFALFAADGYHAVSLAAIAAQAHVAVRTIYAHAGGKPGVLAALIEREHRRHAAQLARLPPPPLPARVAQAACWPHRLGLLARHLCERVADARFLALQRCVIASADQTLAAACHAAGPGQFIAVLERDFAAAGWQADTALLVELFIAIMAGPQLQRYMAGAGGLAAAGPDQRVELFLAAMVRA